MSEYPQIHLITHEYPPFKGGAATFCREMAVAASAMGFPFHVWGPRYLGSSCHRAALTCHALPLRGQLDLLDQLILLWAMRSRVRRQFKEGDVLHLAEPGPVAVATRFPGAVAFAAGNLIITLHGSEIIYHTRHAAAARRFERLLNQARTVHLLSSHNAELLRSRLPKLNSRLEIIPGGPRQFPVQNPALVEKLPPPANFELIQVARLHPRKGQDMLINALGSLPADTREQIRLWCVGPIRDHAYFRRCYQLSRARGVPVHFIHGCPDALLPALYRRAQIAVMSSVESGGSIEGFGLANLEASSFGLPVVAFDCGGIRETIVDGETGVLVPPGDIEALHGVIRKLITSPETRKMLSLQAESHAASFSWSRAAAQLYDRTPRA